MKIKVCSDNATAIQAALDAINGRAAAFTVDKAASVIEIAEDAERRLEAVGITKARRAGITAAYRPAGPGNSYRHWAISTLVELERGTRDGTWWP